MLGDTSRRAGGFLCALRLPHALASRPATVFCCAALSSSVNAVCPVTPAGLKFAQLVVGPEEQAQLAALGISKTPALVALKGSDLSQRTLYEGELGLSGRQNRELGHLSSEQPDQQHTAMAAMLSTVLQRWAFCVLPTSLSYPLAPAAGELKAPRILDWLKQLASGIQGSGRQERVVGEADVIEAKDKASKGDKKAGQGGKAEKKEDTKEQKEKVPAEIPQVRWWGWGCWRQAAAAFVWGGRRLGMPAAGIAAPGCGQRCCAAGCVLPTCQLPLTGVRQPLLLSCDRCRWWPM